MLQRKPKLLLGRKAEHHHNVEDYFHLLLSILYDIINKTQKIHFSSSDNIH